MNIHFMSIYHSIRRQNKKTYTSRRFYI